MIELKAKLWRGVGMAALTAGAVSLTACSPAAQKAPPAPVAPVAGGAGEAAIGESGGESGEAGVSAVYDGLGPAARTQLRLQHLKGFLLVANKELDAGHGAEAGALVGQGALEVFTPAAAEFGGLDIAPLSAASTALMDGNPTAGALLQTALGAVTQRQGAADAELVRGMLKITGGLYAGVLVDGGVDPIEYQHSLGAALSTRDAFTRAEAGLAAKNPARAREAKAEMSKLLALWPSVQAPDAPAPAAQVNAQISRVELALSGL